MFGICVPEEPCVTDANELQDCWSVIGCFLVLCVAFIVLLTRRRYSSHELVLLAGIMEGVLAGALTLTWYTTAFFEFFVCHSIITGSSSLVIHLRKRMWSADDGQDGAEGHTMAGVPSVQEAVSRIVGSALLGGFAIAGIFAAVWRASRSALAAESIMPFTFVLLALALAVCWLLYEGKQLQLQYSIHEPLQLVISLHVDFFTRTLR